jgi:hypothetical protein
MAESIVYDGIAFGFTSTHANKYLSQLTLLSLLLAGGNTLYVLTYNCK